MNTRDGYIAIIRILGFVLGFYWITSLVWAIDYMGTDYIGPMIFQLLFQGLLIYLMLFETNFIIRVLFRNLEEKDISGNISIQSVVTAGIILLGIYVSFYSLSDIILYMISDHKGFSEYLGDDRFITFNVFVHSTIKFILGVILILFNRPLSMWILKSSDRKN